MELDTVHCGDALDWLRTLPDESVNCIVTSPPYWGLRNYNADGQMGLEPTYQEHVAALVDLFREARRVLRNDGTLWLNYGDCYASTPNGRSAADTKAAGNDDRTFRDKPFSTIGGSLKPKDLCMLPHRLAIALQDDGWWVRADIVWSKPNPMPESVTDRPTKAHEYVFLLAKSERYYYDAAAIAEPCVAGDRGSTYTSGKTASAKDGGVLRPVGNGPRTDKQAATGKRQYTGFNDRWDAAPTTSRNKRDVWTVATQPTPEAHFATFPEKLIEPMILAGCPADGIVLDPFFGSGTTGLVARRLGRHFVGCDLNPAYVAIAERRLAQPYTLPIMFDLLPEADGG